MTLLWQQDFQEGNVAPIFLLTSQVGGLGLTLTKADRVIVADPAWNPRLNWAFLLFHYNCDHSYWVQWHIPLLINLQYWCSKCWSCIPYWTKEGCCCIPLNDLWYCGRKDIQKTGQTLSIFYSKMLFSVFLFLVFHIWYLSLTRQIYKGGLFRSATEHKEQIRYFSQQVSTQSVILLLFVLV